MKNVWSKSKRQSIGILAIATFIAIGTYLLLASHASTPNTSLEAENGTLTGNVNKGTDAAASGGSYVKFGDNTVPVGTAPVLKVATDKFVNDSGVTLQLAGINRTGTEFACANQNPRAFTMGPGGSVGGTSMSYAKTAVQALLTWDKPNTPITGSHAINTVRIPLNEECWLGINGAPAAYSGTAYQQFIQGMVDQATAQNMYVVLDLHWADDGSLFPQGQNIAPNANHSVTFWDQVSKQFGTQKGYTNVAFDLFNEPAIYCRSGNGCPASVVNGGYLAADDWAWTLYRDGGNYTWVSADGGYAGNRVGQTWQIAGTQTLLNKIRANGAKNVIIVETLGGGSGYIDRMGAHLPVDSLSPSQVAASVHTYKGTFSFGDAAGQASADNQFNYNGNNITGHYPVYIGEFGTNKGPNTIDSTWVNNSVDYMLSKHFGLTAWGWEETQGTNTLVTSSNNGTTTAFGAVMKTRLQALQ